MRKEERAKIVSEVLNKYYPRPKVPLKHKSTYTLLIAVLLSAQTTDERVNLVTPKLFAKASTPKAMVKLTVKEIQEIIQTCGLAPKKAHAIWGLSNILIEKHRGRVPDTFEDLEALPGVGHKTASVVMAHAFGHPAFPVDTHIFRSAQRWGLSRGKNVVVVERDLKRLFSEKRWNRLHLQIILFARLYCPARGHKTSECPLCSKLCKK
ncbi:MAG: Endonuclease III [Chlamydiae bacterium]|nr:Endonuclease III [Chlamydiota bacterium]